MSFGITAGSALGDAKNEALQRIERSQRFLRAEHALVAFFDHLGQLPSIGDVAIVTTDATYYGDKDAVVALYLDAEHQATTLLREIVKALGVKIEKAPQWDGKSLQASFTFGRIDVNIFGYKPETCRIVEEEVYEEVKDPIVKELVDPDGTRTISGVFMKKKKTRVVCEPAETEEVADVAQA